MINLQISSVIKEKIKGMKFGLLSSKPVTVKKDDPNITNVLLSLENGLKDKFIFHPPSENEIVGHVRRMYRRIGWEPTRYRPSSEALIRRILKGKALYRINNLVDYGNIVSAKFHIPMGLYDTEKINGQVVFDIGRTGETYQGISKEKIHAEGKLILRDDTGIFGNPTADSMRTSIRDNTHSVLAVFFCPPEVEDAYLREVLENLKIYYVQTCPETLTELLVYKP
ncbi:MAG: phenylalanine--tRNA ligase beta subunit-related protein [Calditrichaceae bacterium]